MSEQMVRVLGFDWVLALLSPRAHSATVFLALRILLGLLAHPNLLNKFREGSGHGGWLSDADSVVRNRAAVSHPKLFIFSSYRSFLVFLSLPMGDQSVPKSI